MIISERIFLKLEEKKMTQLQFSKQTGITQSTISDWKRKKTNPSSDKIMIICDVLGISPYELLSGIENENTNNPDYVIVERGNMEYKILDMFREMTPLEKQRVIGYMEAIVGE